MFPFPTIDPAQNNVEGSADTLMVLVDRPEVRAVAEFLATPEGIQNWIRAGSAISTNSTTPADWYAGAYKLKVAADIANSAAGIGFDASDLMPGKVGAGTFWTESDQMGQRGWHQHRCRSEGHRRQLARPVTSDGLRGASPHGGAPRYYFCEEGGWP